LRALWVPCFCLVSKKKRKKKKRKEVVVLLGIKRATIDIYFLLFLNGEKERKKNMVIQTKSIIAKHFCLKVPKQLCLNSCISLLEVPKQV
jgi:heme/copper-type cytochrome/quinol oxidase subunit 4